VLLILIFPVVHILPISGGKGSKTGKNGSSGISAFRRAKMNVSRKSFFRGSVFFIFVSATKEIQILKNQTIQPLKNQDPKPLKTKE
jgi:hypothetical protein